MGKETTIHRLRRRRRRCSNLIRPSGLVKMSAQFCADSTLVISRDPLWIWSWKWWNLKEMCFVLGLKLDSMVASTIHAVLSLYTRDGEITDLKDGLAMESGSVVDRETNECVTMCCRMRRKGSNCRVAVERAIYSLSVVNNAISDCNLLAHETGHSQ